MMCVSGRQDDDLWRGSVWLRPCLVFLIVFLIVLIVVFAGSETLQSKAAKRRHVIAWGASPRI